jgi:hypothetical protein
MSANVQIYRQAEFGYILATWAAKTGILGLLLRKKKATQL